MAINPRPVAIARMVPVVVHSSVSVVSGTAFPSTRRYTEVHRPAFNRATKRTRHNRIAWTPVVDRRRKWVRVRCPGRFDARRRASDGLTSVDERSLRCRNFYLFFVFPSTSVGRSPPQGLAMSLDKDDGAVEKLMEEGNTKHVEDAAGGGDKYDELNKLDVSDHTAGTAYAGMGKEELMKYANSPFWVRLRWLLFVTFWLSWFAMMFGALFIIFVTPKCLPSTKLEWFQRSPVYVISAASLVGQNGKLAVLLCFIQVHRHGGPNRFHYLCSIQ